MNIQLSSRTDLWYTPKSIVDKVTEVLGGIDFDPASDRFANETVQATKYLYEDGLNTCLWGSGSVFLNPPGGKVANKSQTALFWQALMCHTERLDFTHGIFLAFSAEALQNTQDKGCKALGEFLLCIPKKRIRFDGLSGKKAPSHSNVIAYIPGSIDRSELFIAAFSEVGTILNKRSV